MSAAGAGIVRLRLGFEPVPGMVTHPESFPFPVTYATLSGKDLVGRVLSGDETLYREVRRAALDLVQDGVCWLGTSCGYFSAYQRRLADELPVPVFTSPLIQIPQVLASMPSSRRLAVVWAGRNEAMVPALNGAGVDPADPRLIHVDLDRPGMFRDAILTGTVPLDSVALRDQIATTCRDLVATHSDIGGVVLECGELSAYAEAARSASGVPVWDYRALFTWAATAAPPAGAHVSGTQAVSGMTVD